MTRPTPEQVREQIRRDAAEAALRCPEPTTEQLWPVRHVLDAASERRSDDGKAGAA